MASKDEMRREIVEYYSTNALMFKQVGIDQKTFASWFNSFKDYKDYEKVYNYFFVNKDNLANHINRMWEVWNLSDSPNKEEFWAVWLITEPQDRICRLFREAKALVLIKWRKRLPKRRKSE